MLDKLTGTYVCLVTKYLFTGSRESQGTQQSQPLRGMERIENNQETLVFSCHTATVPTAQYKQDHILEGRTRVLSSTMY